MTSPRTSGRPAVWSESSPPCTGPASRVYCTKIELPDVVPSASSWANSQAAWRILVLMSQLDFTDQFIEKIPRAAPSLTLHGQPGSPTTSKLLHDMLLQSMICCGKEQLIFSLTLTCGMSALSNQLFMWCFLQTGKISGEPWQNDRTHGFCWQTHLRIRQRWRRFYYMGPHSSTSYHRLTSILHPFCKTVKHNKTGCVFHISSVSFFCVLLFDILRCERIMDSATHNLETRGDPVTISVPMATPATSSLSYAQWLLWLLSIAVNYCLEVAAIQHATNVKLPETQ